MWDEEGGLKVFFKVVSGSWLGTVTGVSGKGVLRAHGAWKIKRFAVGLGSLRRRVWVTVGGRAWIKPNPYPQQPPLAKGTHLSLTCLGLPRMAAAAAQSRFSKPAGRRLAGKFVSSSMVGMSDGRELES
jgi:hypothetical protein